MAKKVSLVDCPRCETPMLAGYLTGPVEPVHVESMQSLQGSSLQALICPTCAYVELRAARLENLIRKDISDEEMADL